MWYNQPDHLHYYYYYYFDRLKLLFFYCYHYYDGVYGYQSINPLISIMTMDISPINKKTS